MAPLINYSVTDNHIAVVTLNRPEAMNALSAPLLDELNAYIEKINNDDTIRTTIITGAGQKAFCAGADLKERKGMTEKQVVQAVEKIGRTINNIESMNMPVIAAMNGAAFGGGLELALGCDIRIAATGVKMGLTETSLAIIPGAGGTQRLTRLIGTGQAKKLIFTAEPVLAEEALKHGVIEQISDPSQLWEEAYSLAAQIAKNGPIALKQAKAAINKGIQTDLSTGLSIERLCYNETIPTDDRIEGLQAFKEKREPVYQGK
ncbi:enoyl-CoA hydratase [Lentibacillus cibarius]|uniref:Enoyl-CoA hydratase n=1 Tax=Lentibacillus cibarius TaxID=2583219 RepID=A0A5S3QP18_9BACI|nr:enoyl-CoA hydratase [Lentibacillus cibarius]TMN23674.1 enoyl-CoA hydratase [Lentibacillus cibarius]